MIELILCFPPNSPFTLKFDPSNSVIDLKLHLFSILPNIPEEQEGQEMRLVCRGRVLQDNLSLGCQGLVDQSKIYISIKQPSPIDSKSKSSLGPSSDPMMSTLLKFMESNPEMYQQLLLSNPQIQNLLEKNPELRHALSDPSTLKTMLTAATNPKAYNEMMRGHDRALSNLENIPEGFSHLKKMYTTLQEPMYDAMSMQPPRKTIPDAIEEVTTEKRRTTTWEPIPNPWAPKTSIPSRSVLSPNYRGIQSQKRKLGSTTGDDNNLNFLSTTDSVNISDKSTSTNISFKSISTLKETFQSQLEVLHQLGFNDDEGENVPALLATGGHVPAAIDRILSKRI